MLYATRMKKLFLVLAASLVGLALALATVTPTPIEITKIGDAPGLLIFVLGAIAVTSSSGLIASTSEISRMVYTYRIRELTVNGVFKDKSLRPGAIPCLYLSASDGKRRLQMALQPGQLDPYLPWGTKVELAYFNTSSGTYVDKVYNVSKA